MNSLKEDAAMRVKNSLVIDKIAKEENIVVSQEEFGAKIAEISHMYQIDPQTMIKQLSQTQRERIAKQYQNTTRTTSIGEMKKL